MLSHLSISDFTIAVVYNFMFNDTNMINSFFVIFSKLLGIVTLKIERCSDFFLLFFWKYKMCLCTQSLNDEIRERFHKWKIPFFLTFQFWFLLKSVMKNTIKITVFQPSRKGNLKALWHFYFASVSLL